MPKNPFRPPNTPKPRGDAQVDGLGFFGSVLSSLVATILPPIWLIGLAIGWATDKPWLFHAIYATIVLVPSVFLLVFAFMGRSGIEKPTALRKVGDFIGTAGFLLVGGAGCVAYIAAVLSKSVQ